MTPTVVIDCFPESVLRYKRGYTIVAVDVIRATTTMITAVSMGRRCFPVSSREAGCRLSAQLCNPLLAGELGGVVPRGFEMNNSPAELLRRTDVSRPLILLSSSGTKLIDFGRESDALYLGCLRNYSAAARCVAERHSRVAIIGAGSRGDFRVEDQMCCAWIACHLLENGFAAANPATQALVKRWPVGHLVPILTGASADYLVQSGQGRDSEFVLSHVADLDFGYLLEGDEVVEVAAGEGSLVAVQEGSRQSLPRRQTL